MRLFQRPYTSTEGKEKVGKTWWCQFSVGGKRHYLTTGSRDKRAAQLIANDFMRRAELSRAGIRDPYGEAKAKSIGEHLKDFLTTIRAREVVAKYVAERTKHLETFFAAANVKNADDLDLTRASHWLTEERKRGLAARSVNARRAALCQFSRWLLRTRRAQFDPLEGLKALNEEADRRRVRRALTPDEAVRLLDAARTRAIARAGVPHPKAKPERRERTERTLAKMTRLGEARALLYLIAMGTGLRKSEVQRLRWCDLDLERGRLTVPAKSAKSRRDQGVDLHPAVAAALVAWKPPGAASTDTVLPPRSMPNSWTFDRDLAAAGIAKLDDEGRVVDLHALRTTFISWLGASGAHPRVAQALARHASVETTMDRYTDLRLFDTKGSVGRLPLPEGAPTRAQTA